MSSTPAAFSLEGPEGDDFEDVALVLEAEERQQAARRNGWWSRAQRWLPGWLRPTSRSSYGFTRLRASEESEEGGGGAGGAASGGGGRDASLPAAAQRPKGRWCPEETASLLSHLLFLYVGPLVRMGYVKTLDQEDLWDVAREDEAHSEDLWDVAREDDAHSVAEAFMWHLRSTVDGERAPQGVIWKAMWHAHRRGFVISGVIKLVHDVVMFAGPVLLELLLKHVQAGVLPGRTGQGLWHRWRHGWRTNGSAWAGLGLATALAGAAVVETLTVNWYFHMLFRMSLHLKVGLVNALFRKSLRISSAAMLSVVGLVDALFRKSLRISSAAKSEAGVGAIVNIQSNDAAKLWNLPQYMHMIWSGPFQILATMALLVRVIHWVPALAGLGVTVAIIPASTWLGKRLGALRKELIRHTDARVKLCTEVITGIKAIKLYAWEGPYVERISALREEELGAIRQSSLLGTFNNLVFTTAPVLISLAAFLAYAALGYPLTAAVAFPALSLFNLLRFPVAMFPQQIVNIINGRVALSRIQAFMEVDEMVQPALQPRALAPAPAVDMRGADFAWKAASPPLLRGIDLEVAAGRLVIVVGSVGTGKSSLLAAILGEMVAVKGSVQARGRVALTQQDPWIENASLRENILMGSPLDPPRYQRVLDACALVPDLEMLPAGDETEIGEKGVNLSGGQRHRVALARACYSGADLYLLDDPLSAVDAHVGRHLFDKCICGLLAGATRVLVTHQLQYLEAADCVVVVRDGRIFERGTYRELTARGVDFHQFECNSEGEEEEEGGENGGKADPTTAGRGREVGLAAEGAGEATAAAGEAGTAGRAGPAAAPVREEECKSSSLGLLGTEPGLPDLAAELAAAGAAAAAAGTAGIAGDGQLESLSSECAGAGIFGNGYLGEGIPGIDVCAAAETGTVAAPAPSGAALASELEAPAPAASDVSLSTGGSPPGANGSAAPENGGAYYKFSPKPPLLMAPTINLLNPPRPPSPAHRPKSPSPPGAEPARSNGAAKGAGAAGAPAKAPAGAASRAQLTAKEGRAVGRVDREIYRVYFAAWSPHYVLPLAMLGLALVERGLLALQNWWLSVWSNATADVEASMPSAPNGPSGPSVATGFYLGVYFAFGIGSLLLQGGRAVLLVVGTVNAARELHSNLLAKVVRLPQSFFDSQPTGRLLNRFTKDTEAVDTQIGSSVFSFLNCAVSVLWSLVVVVAVSPAIMGAIVPLAASYYWVQARYIQTSRELKRLDSLALSPIFGHFSETLHGLMTVRAFRRQPGFEARNAELLNQSNRAYWPAQCINRWLSVRLELLGISVVFGTAVFVTVVMPTNAGLAGLALTSALNLTGLMNWMVRMTTELEVNLNSVERMVEYTTYESEAPAVIPERRPLPGWPSQASGPGSGAIEVQQLVVRYRPDLDPVLKGISFSIRGREKVGVAGRTGCGKSTLMLALYRLVEPSAGRILIDSLDTGSIGLYDLRSRLALVPQAAYVVVWDLVKQQSSRAAAAARGGAHHEHGLECGDPKAPSWPGCSYLLDPVVFSGSVRSNLDPFGDAGGDDAIWAALRQAGLRDTVRALAGGLDAQVAEGGTNLSVGQRQLLCMARALLRAARILILDEATSNVDTGTDTLIQSTIATAFADCTVLTIAHRLHTIMESDRILVLHEGTVREFDSPAALLRRPGSAFRALVEETARGQGAGA
ncbi:hypothetical protein N2152v2_002592 [Parachlorella kessleri]